MGHTIHHDKTRERTWEGYGAILERYTPLYITGVNCNEGLQNDRKDFVSIYHITSPDVRSLSDKPRQHAEPISAKEQPAF